MAGSVGAGERGVTIIGAMVIDMNEAQVRTLEQVRLVVAGTQALEFRRAEDDEGRYGWIEQVLRRFGYRQLGRADKGAVLAYLQHLSGYSRAQVTRLVSRWVASKPLVKNYRRPEHAFARRYTAADVGLLAEVDRAMGTLSGPATACVLRRQRDVFKVPGFERLGEPVWNFVCEALDDVQQQEHLCHARRSRPERPGRRCRPFPMNWSTNL